MKLHELPKEDWPREKLLQRGTNSLSDAELLALLLRTGSHGRDVLEMAYDVLREAGGLRGLARHSPQEIQTIVKGIGPAKACELAAVLELGRRSVVQKYSEEKLDNPDSVYELMAPDMLPLRQESLRVILLNTRYFLLRVVTISTGSVNESIADPREIFRPAIVHNAFAMILVHNHPSGDPSPSESDRSMTRRMNEVAGLHRIRLLDHIIIGSHGNGRAPYFSFKEAGLL